MKRYFVPILVVAVAAFASCKEEDDPTPPGGNTDPDAVEVTISTTTIETKANATIQFKATDKMNIFAKKTSDPKSDNYVDGVVATYDGTTWTMSPAVKLSKGQNVFIYAIAPYDPSYTGVTEIPVDVNKQVDLLYSGAFVAASYTTNTVKLNMKHALSLTTYNIVPVNYSGSGVLQSLSINGEIVYATGTLNSTTGKITKGQTGEVSAKFKRDIQPGGWTSDIPGIWVIPFNTKTGDVTFTAVIDGHTYTTRLPEVEIKTGFQYIFRLALTDNGLEFDPSKTETRSLNQDDDQGIDFEGFGRIVLTANGSSLLVPTLAGDAVFGTIVAPTASFSYQPEYLVEGLQSGNVVTIESWNTTGFTLESLEGIEEIDLSQY